MHILITGATGLIGKEIVKCCHEKNFSVNYLTTSKDKLVQKNNYRGFYWNPSSGEIDLKCLSGVHAIINLAGASLSKRWTTAYKKEIIRSRIESIQLLKKALDEVDHHVESFITASAIGIYPDSYDNYYEEDEPLIDDSFLGKVVELWEKEAGSLSGRKFSLAKIRIGLVLSEKGGALPQISRPVKWYVGTTFGDGKQWQSWIHIKDLSRLFIFAVENRLSGAFNGVAPNPVSNKKLVKEIASVLKRPLILPNIPEPIMKVILGEMAYVLYASQRVSSKKIEEFGFNFDYPNITLALKEIYHKQKNPV